MILLWIQEGKDGSGGKGAALQFNLATLKTQRGMFGFAGITRKTAPHCTT